MTPKRIRHKTPHTATTTLTHSPIVMHVTSHTTLLYFPLLLFMSLLCTFARCFLLPGERAQCATLLRRRRQQTTSLHLTTSLVSYGMKQTKG